MTQQLPVSNLSESEVQQLIQIEAAKYDCILMRNNSGAMKDVTGRVVRYGLGNVSPKQKSKSIDLIGITTITITPEMVGQKIGVFTAFEIKKEDWNPSKKLDDHEQHQKNFIDFVLSKGGIASFLNSVDGLRSALRR